MSMHVCCTLTNQSVSQSVSNVNKTQDLGQAQHFMQRQIVKHNTYCNAMNTQSRDIRWDKSKVLYVDVDQNS